MNMFNNLFSSQNINGDIMSAQFDKMKAEFNKLEAEKNKLKTEKNKLKAEKDKLKAEKDKLEAEKNKLKAEKNKLEADRLKPRPYNEKVLVDIEQLKVKAQDDGKTLIHENQISTAGKVLEKWRSNKDSRFTIILGQTQVGKTGCILSVIEHIYTSADFKNYKILVTTGLNDNTWRDQTKYRLPASLEVLHRAGLKDKVLSSDTVVIVDECQIAATEKMSIDKFLASNGLKDFKNLCQRNIRIVCFSATPNKTLDDIKKWAGNSDTLILKPGVGYKGHNDLLVNNRIRQAEDLNCITVDKLAELKTFIETEYYDDKRYHIIRTPTGEQRDIILKKIKDIFGPTFNYLECDSFSTLKLEEVIKKTLTKQTIIFLKEAARCASTLPYKNRIGVLYERIPQDVQDDIMIQGLAGRNCGYDTDPKTMVYTNIPSIQRYVDMVESSFENRDEFRYTGKKKKNKSVYAPSGYTSTGDIVLDEEEPTNPDFDHVVFENNSEGKQFRTFVYNTKTNVGPKAPAELRKSNNDKDPTIDYILKRQWGLPTSKLDFNRYVKLDDGKVCVYWRPSNQQQITLDKIQRYRTKNNI